MGVAEGLFASYGTAGGRLVGRLYERVSQGVRLLAIVRGSERYVMGAIVVLACAASGAPPPAAPQRLHLTARPVRRDYPPEPPQSA